MPLSTLEAALNLRHATDTKKSKKKAAVKKVKIVKKAVTKVIVHKKPEVLQKKVDLCKA